MKNQNVDCMLRTGSLTRSLLLAVTFMIMCLPPTMATTFTKQAYSVGKNPVALAFGNFNGDANRDLAVANHDGNTVSVLLGRSNGTFHPAVNYIVGAQPTAIAVGDFNSDHKVDLAVASTGNAAVSILLGRGDGTFQPAIDHPAGNGVFSVSVADFNGDGKLDLAVTNSLGVATLLGSGNGSFSGPHVFNIGGKTATVAVADFNNDGKMDIAAKQTVADTSLTVLLGDGKNHFLRSWRDNPSLDIASFAIGDFDRDGRLDQAALYNTPIGFGIRLLQVLHGNGNGTFTKAWSQRIQLPAFITAGFLNSDTRPDLGILGLPIGSLNSRLLIFLGNTNGSFQLTQNFTLSIRATSMMIKDLNHDGLGDIVLTNSVKNTIVVLLNLP